MTFGVRAGLPLFLPVLSVSHAIWNAATPVNVARWFDKLVSFQLPEPRHYRRNLLQKVVNDNDRACVLSGIFERQRQPLLNLRQVLLEL